MGVGQKEERGVIPTSQNHPSAALPRNPQSSRTSSTLRSRIPGRLASGCFWDVSKKKASLSQAGFTLFEILVVLGLVAFIAAMTVNSIPSITPGQRMRDESVRLINIARYTYYQAASDGLYYRLTFDLDENNYFIEYSSEPFYVVREGDEKEAIRIRNEEDAKAFDSSIDLDTETDEESEENAAPPVAEFSELDDELIETRSLGGSVRFHSIYVMHQTEPVKEGKAHLYFFPRGQTEFAILTLTTADKDEDAEEVAADALTLIVNPLTAAVEVREGFVDFEDILEEVGGVK